MNFILTMLFISSLWIPGVSAKAEPLSLFDNLHLVQACNIRDFAGTIIKKFPGDMCIFLEDGSFISASDKSLRFFTKEDKISWEIPGHYHHQINLSVDKKRILALSSDYIAIDGKKARTDKLLVLDMKGKVLYKQTSDVLFKQLKNKWPAWPITPWVKSATGADLEVSRFNSFYEIPKNKNNKILKEGDFIINDHAHLMLVVTHDLKKIVLEKALNSSLQHHTHDIQVNPQGNLIYFNNIHAESTPTNLYSAIQEYDIVNNKMIFEFTSTPKAMFFSRARGGVQSLGNDYFLFSDQFNGTYIISKDTKKMIRSMRGTHLEGDLLLMNQQIKAQDLTKFLENRKK
jgi:hypothetical protein